MGRSASYCFLNLSRKSFEAADRVIFFCRERHLRPHFQRVTCETGFGVLGVLSTKSQSPLVIP